MFPSIGLSLFAQEMTLSHKIIRFDILKGNVKFYPLEQLLIVALPIKPAISLWLLRILLAMARGNSVFSLLV